MTAETKETSVIEAVTPEACANCGTVLAADQRYCLNCGDRRSESRLDFIDILSEDAAGRPAAAAAVVASQAPDRKPGVEGWIRHHAGVLSLVAIVLLAAVGGAVIGSALGDDGSSGATAKPQVISVEGAAGSGSDDAAADADADAAADDSADDSAAADEPAEEGGSGSAKGVDSADNKSSADIEKSVDKGEPLSTGDGDLPPTDDKAAGGGSDFDTIE